jgi:Mn-dependent DtxR family transcriptional regulator
VIIDLLRQDLALQLSKQGLRVADIGKRLHIATGSVVKMLKGVRKEK